ncbi:hypothetical protein Y032_0122g1045 [Ancylostoma ceylanicum]|uniref:Uncharacterized protein n=1 Tax=Ancylostoma ceylanicum TaxID=53326 RepID=A0A016T9X4_9BILA|nr:hypothetical protein Y032_0122g1045 [Ancylostoma ceylanicum]
MTTRRTSSTTEPLHSEHAFTTSFMKKRCGSAASAIWSAHGIRLSFRKALHLFQLIHSQSNKDGETIN